VKIIGRFLFEAANEGMEKFIEVRPDTPAEKKWV